MVGTIELLDRTDTGVLWPDSKRGPFYVVAHWAEVDGQPECVGLEVWKTAIPDGRRVHPIGRKLQRFAATDLRRLPIASLLRDLWQVQRDAASRRARAHLQEGGAWWRDTSADPAARKAALAEHRREATAALKLSRHDPAAGHLEQVARVYSDAVMNREPPTKKVQETFAVSHSTATKWARKAREAGLLPKTQPGRASKAATKDKGDKK